MKLRKRGGGTCWNFNCAERLKNSVSQRSGRTLRELPPKKLNVHEHLLPKSLKEFDNNTRYANS
jgi:hypothetical protein